MALPHHQQRVAAMSRSSALSLLSALVLCWGSAQAQSLLALTEQTLGHDARWHAQALEVQAAEHRRLQARAALLPQVGLQASSEYSDNHVRAQLPQLGTQNQTLHARQDNVGVQLVQPLYAPALHVQYQEGKQALELSHAQREAQRQSLLLQVAQAYFEALMARDALAVQETLVEAVRSQSALAQRNFDLGLTTITDVREAQARLDLAQAQRLGLQNQWYSALLSLEKLSGQPQPNLWFLPEEAQLPAIDSALQAQWLQELDDVHPLLQQADMARRLAQLRTQKAKAAHQPTVQLQASYGRQRNPDGSLTMAYPHRVTVGTIGVQAQVPLFAGFGIEQRVREALVQEEQAQAQWLDTLRSLEQAVRQAWLGLQAAQQQSSALKQAVASSETALQATQTGYRVGVRINVDVLNAQVQLHNARKDWLRARYQVLLGQLQLLQAAGRLQLQDVEAISALLKPATQQPHP